MNSVVMAGSLLSFDVPSLLQAVSLSRQYTLIRLWDRERRPTGETYSPELGRQFPERDWILTRILWLSGCEPGYNRLGKVDTMRRAIYIHGSPDSAEMGKAGSHGCIRMHNRDIVELFDLVPIRTPVEIHE